MSERTTHFKVPKKHVLSLLKPKTLARAQTATADNDPVGTCIIKSRFAGGGSVRQTGVKKSVCNLTARHVGGKATFIPD
jgi:hypothetical protein